MSLFSYQPRRNVPWGAVDVALLIVVYYIVPTLVISAIWFSDLAPACPKPPVAEAAAEAGADTSHPLQQILRESQNPWAFWMCIVLAVVIAPMIEEYLFRVVLQGWLEKLEWRFRHRNRWFRPAFAGVLPVGLTSLAFAALHFRTAAPPTDVSIQTFRLGAQAVAGLVTFAIVFGWLKLAAGATAEDLGIVSRNPVGDVALGLIAFLIITVPVYLAGSVAREILPKGIAPDPIAIFVLSAALGTLYYRTHRILPCIVTHMAFNATGILLALSAMGKL